MNNEINLQLVIETIKKRGYWKFIIEPTKTITKPFDHPSDAISVIQDESIKLRGWYYPHIPTQDNERQRLDIQEDRIDGYIIMDHFREAWSYFSSSGQFIHLLALREDWFQESSWIEGDHYLKKIEPNKYLDFVGTTLTLTEMFLFAKNIINTIDYNNSIKLSISLHNAQGRALTTFDPRRIPMFFNYATSTNEMVAFNEIISKEELNKATLELAEKAAIRVFKYFKGFNPPVHVIKDDQVKLIERKL